MKKLLASALLVSATTVSAESLTTMQSICGETEQIIEYMVSYGLDPMVTSPTSTIFDEEGNKVTGVMVFWHNADDGSGNYSVTFSLDANPDISCILTMGQELAPFGA